MSWRLVAGFETALHGIWLQWPQLGARSALSAVLGCLKPSTLEAVTLQWHHAVVDSIAGGRAAVVQLNGCVPHCLPRCGITLQRVRECTTPIALLHRSAQPALPRSTRSTRGAAATSVRSAAQALLWRHWHGLCWGSHPGLLAPSHQSPGAGAANEALLG
jgi:hypothetical protein